MDDEIRLPRTIASIEKEHGIKFTDEEIDREMRRILALPEELQEEEYKKLLRKKVN